MRLIAIFTMIMATGSIPTIAATQGAQQAASFRPADLRCEYSVDPLGIDIAQPEFAAVSAGDHQHIAAEIRAKSRAGAEKCNVDRPMNLAAQPDLRIGGLGMCGVAGVGLSAHGLIRQNRSVI